MVKESEPIQGYKGKFFHSKHMTIVHWDISKGAKLPEHSHPHEQVANMIEGRYEITVYGKKK